MIIVFCSHKLYKIIYKVIQINHHLWRVLPKSDAFVQEIKIALVIDNESRDLQLYNDSFLILIGHAKAGLCNFKVCLYENSKQSYCPLKLQVSFGTSFFYIFSLFGYMHFSVLSSVQFRLISVEHITFICLFVWWCSVTWSIVSLLYTCKINYMERSFIMSHKLQVGS